MTGDWFVIANADAGTAEDAAVALAVAALAEHGAVRLCRTASPAELDTALDSAAGATVVVAGGDGSLHAILERLHGRGEAATRAVGLVPLGTGNDFARGYGLPLDPAGAAARLVAGVPRPVDLIEYDGGGVVVNAAHAGVGAVATARAEGLKNRLGRLAYPLGALLAGARAEGWSLAVEVDGRTVELPGTTTLLVGVGNGPYIGGGTALFPGARPEDGRLDLVVCTATGTSARAAFGLALERGTHLDRDDVVSTTGTVVRISGEPVGHNIDGELQPAVTDRTYRLLPAGWRLVA